MIEYIIYGLYSFVVVMGTIVLGLLFFRIIDIVMWMSNKLGDLIFGKEK